MTIGIDLGTCYSAVGFLAEHGIELIPNTYGNRITPSCVAVSKDEVLVGDDAIFVKDDPDFTFIEKSKVLMGTDTIYHTPRGDLRPEDVAFLILQHLVNYSTGFAKTAPQKAVITVPAYFNAHQRKLTREAAEKTGLEILRIISEPTAAALTTSALPDGSRILVYDLGGGTFDCSILEVYKGFARVIATHGNTSLGGRDFDEAISKWLIPQFDSLSHYEQRKLLTLAEQAKKQLTNRDRAVVNLREIVSTLRPQEITYHDLKDISKSLLDKTKDCIFDCLKDAELEPSDIDRVYMVGGSTRMRIVGELLEKIFPIKPQILGNPDECVAEGATIHAQDIGGSMNDVLLVDVVPLSLGVEIENGFFKKIIKRNSPIPCDFEQIFTTAYDFQEKVEIKVYQGEAELAKNNINLGILSLSNLEKALRGEPQILVKFSLDADAVLHVEAKDLKTNSFTKATLNYEFQEGDETQDFVDDAVELQIATLKSKLSLMLYDTEMNMEKMTLINDALKSTHLEFVQSVYEDLVS